MMVNLGDMCGFQKANIEIKSAKQCGVGVKENESHL